MKNLLIILTVLFAFGCQESGHSAPTGQPIDRGGLGGDMENPGGGDTDEPGDGDEVPVSDQLFALVNERVIQASCVGCHGGNNPRAGLDLSTRELVDQLVIPGNVEGSTLYAVIASGFMPPRKAVSDQDLELIAEYIESLPID